jgi:cyclase
MLTKRIIPCLDIRDGRTVKGIQFENIRDAGDPVELATRYALQGADELIFLDITATIHKQKILTTLVEKTGRILNIPFTVGGGIHRLQDARDIIKAGADKISVNSAAVARPDLISEIAMEFGSQCVVVAIDAALTDHGWVVATHGGRQGTSLQAAEWAETAAEKGAGEILLTSISHDGLKKGFAIDLYKSVCERVNIPVIASGGAGTASHFEEVFTSTRVSGALAAGIFHDNTLPIPELKSYLHSVHIPVRLS